MVSDTLIDFLMYFCYSMIDLLILWVIIWHKESLIDYMTDFLAQGSVPSVWLHILWLVTPKLATWKRNWRPGVTMILYLMRLTFRLKGFSSIFHYDRLLLAQIARLMTRWCSTNSIEEWLGVFIMLLLHHLARGPQDGLAKMTLRPNRCCDSHSHSSLNASTPRNFTLTDSLGSRTFQERYLGASDTVNRGHCGGEVNRLTQSAIKLHGDIRTRLWYYANGTRVYGLNWTAGHLPNR